MTPRTRSSLRRSINHARLMQAGEGLGQALGLWPLVLGMAMTSIGIGMLAYAYFGAYLPDIIAHRGFGVERLATALYLTTNGIFGVMANVLATYVILFIFFGAFLHRDQRERRHCRFAHMCERPRSRLREAAKPVPSSAVCGDRRR